jgi:hypothetical protein
VRKIWIDVGRIGVGHRGADRRQHDYLHAPSVTAAVEDAAHRLARAIENRDEIRQTRRLRRVLHVWTVR